MYTHPSEQRKCLAKSEKRNHRNPNDIKKGNTIFCTKIHTIKTKKDEDIFCVKMLACVVITLGGR